MSKKRVSKAAAKSGQPPKGSVTVEVDYNRSYETHYANFAGITHTPMDICMDFCLIAPPHHTSQEKKALYAPIVTRVVIPPEMAVGLVEALQKRLGQLSKEIETGTISLSLGENES